MEITTTSIIASLAINYFTQYTHETLKNIFQTAFNLNPSLETELNEAKNKEDIEEVFNKAIGIIEINAKDGKIKINENVINAVTEIRLNHQNGYINLSNSNIFAPVLTTGGNGIGTTEITESILKSNGTEIFMGKGASIVLSGNAEIIQN